MIKLPSVKDLPIEGKKVLLRTNYDVPLLPPIRRDQGKLLVADATRIVESLPTIKYLLKQKAKIIIISHLGRPGGKIVPELSLKPIDQFLSRILRESIPLFSEIKKLRNLEIKLAMLENLRFWPGEEDNNKDFAKELAGLANFFVNEAFACSHRKHTSIVGVPAQFPASQRAFGFDFLKEIKVLSGVRENPKRPVVLILGGVKEDKIGYGKKLFHWGDYLLLGGKLVEHDSIPPLLDHQKVVGSLIKDGQDITMRTVEEFAKIISKAKTIVWSGPMGNFYDERYALGTKRIAEAVVKSGAFSIVGGGDTEAALTKFGLVDKIDYISSGGGAMLEFLAQGTLVGIEAINYG